MVQFFCICFAKNAIPSLESSIQHLSREDELFIFRLLMYTVLYNVFSTNIIFSFFFFILESTKIHENITNREFCSIENDIQKIVYQWTIKKYVSLILWVCINMQSKIQIKRLEGKNLDICRIFEGLFIEWKSLLHLGPTISLLKGGYGGAIFCFKIILLDTFLE